MDPVKRARRADFRYILMCSFSEPSRSFSDPVRRARRADLQGKQEEERLRIRHENHMKEERRKQVKEDAAEMLGSAAVQRGQWHSSARRQELLERLPDPAAVPGRVFAAEELRAYDGNHARTEGKVYLAVCGLVYDMSAGAKYYGPGGPYGTLAGHDATLCLAKHSLAPALRDAPWSAEQGAAAPLSPEEEGTLANFLKTFAKYPIVGRLAVRGG